MRINPVSMTNIRISSRQNLRPQNLKQNVSFSGDEKEKEYTREEIDKMILEYAEKVKRGEIVPKESEPKPDENYKDNLELAWELYGTRN